MSDQEFRGFVIRSGDLADSMTVLIKHSGLSQWVAVTERDGILSHVTEFQSHSLPERAWSTGERLLWDFCLSIAGVGSVNLELFINYFSRSEMRAEVFDVFEAAMERGSV